MALVVGVVHYGPFAYTPKLDYFQGKNSYFQWSWQTFHDIFMKTHFSCKVNFWWVNVPQVIPDYSNKKTDGVCRAKSSEFQIIRKIKTILCRSLIWLLLWITREKKPWKYDFWHFSTQLEPKFFSQGILIRHFCFKLFSKIK